jgi:hypothetical protein
MEALSMLTHHDIKQILWLIGSVVSIAAVIFLAFVAVS